MTYDPHPGPAARPGPPWQPHPSPAPPQPPAVTSARRPPLKSATALVIMQALLLAGSLVAILVSLLFSDALASLLAHSSGGAEIVVIVVMGLLIAALAGGMGLASFVLSILVAVNGTGKLRIGALILLAATLLDAVVRISVSGDFSAGGPMHQIAHGLALVEIGIDVLQMLVTVAGVLVLMLGIAEARRARTEVVRPGL